MTFQYPTEIPGVSNKEFLFQAYNSQRKAKNQRALALPEFEALAQEKMHALGINKEFLNRSINEGFSGGEKKKNEVLQMAVFNPEFTILDETDSGLDVDALKTIAYGIKQFMTPDKALILITHYQRLLDYIHPDYVHIMRNGVITRSGDFSLAKDIEDKGYETVKK